MGAVRDHALALTCLNHGVAAVQARGFDDLPATALGTFAATHVAAVEPAAIRAALGVSVRALTVAGAEARLLHADRVARRLAEPQ